MTETSLFAQIEQEVKSTGNHSSSIEKSKEITKQMEYILDKRVISYFASENGVDDASMINDEDAFILENILKVKSDKKDLVLILHSNGGIAISSERIIDVCRNYCKRRGDNSSFIIIVPKKAKSAATIVALGADKIYLRDTAELGPVDPQFVIKDDKGSIQVQPAYLVIDGMENAFGLSSGFSLSRLFKRDKTLMGNLSRDIKNKIFDKSNYQLYISAKNEIGLSESVIEKISKQKILLNPKISVDDFKIFQDPHITKSHGRLINLSDLKDNSLLKEGFISNLNNLLINEENSSEKPFEDLLWELYVRKRFLLNDTGNNIVKIIESTNDIMINQGLKRGQKQINTPPKTDNETQK